MATAAPTTKSPPDTATAVPEAFAEASVLAEALSVSSPPASALRRSSIAARVSSLVTLIAMAAATLMPPLEVVADGVSAPLLLSVAPFAVARSLAKVRWPPAWPFTPPTGASGSPS